MTSATVNARIFRDYDIRGDAGRDLTDDVARALGTALGEIAANHGGPAVIGHDCRLTSPRLFTALSDGVRTMTDVIDIGGVPTPVAYFAQQLLRPAVTVMITGSHNPSSDNGFKIMVGDETLYGDAIKRLGHRVSELMPLPVPVPHRATTTLAIIPAYLSRAVAELKLGGRRPKVVVDGGNGSGGLIALALYEALGCDVTPLYVDPDGRFPNHHPDPTVPQNLADLAAAVQYVGAEVGIALDGDADRVGVVDATGRILWGDQLMILLGRELLAEVPGARFVGEVKCSQTMYDELTRAGGVVDMWKVGHSLIKARMREVNALLGGEMSGHLFFAHRWLGFDDGIYAGARLIELLSRTPRTLAELAAELPAAINTPEIRIECPDDAKFQVVAQVTERLRADPRVLDTVTIDGVRARFNNGWGLVRASNTQPALVVRCEACDSGALYEIRDLLEQLIAAAKQ